MLLFYRVIRLSSPNLNLLIGLGAIILYLDIIVAVLPTGGEDTLRALKIEILVCNVSLKQSLLFTMTLYQMRVMHECHSGVHVVFIIADILCTCA